MKCDRITPKRYWTAIGELCATQGMEIESALRGTSADQFIRDGYNKQRRRIERRAKSPSSPQATKEPPMSTAKTVQQAAVEYPITVPFPKLNEGEKFVGVIVSADGRYRHCLILLPGEAEPNNWQAQMEWAASIGGELPDRVESALLFATLRDEFKPDWYWTREQHAADSVYAWMQTFGYGNQGYGHKSSYYRARAVRRESF